MIEITRVSIKSLLLNEYLHTYSYKEFYEHCKKCKCEELVDAVVAIYTFQSDYESSINYKPCIDLQVLELKTDEIIKDHKRKKSLTNRLTQLLFGRRVSDHSFPREPVEIDTDSMQTNQSSQSSSKRASDPRSLDQKLLYIINTFIKPNSPKQINIPFIISQNLIKNYESDNRGPGLFSECLEHCEMILKTSALPSFVSERKQFALKLRDIK